MRTYRIAWFVFFCYVMALGFGLGGIAIALRRPELWAHLELGRKIYAFGMHWGGVGYIVLGALAMLLYGWQALGRRVLWFFLISTTLSLAAELIGTSTGWPFGNYSYTAGLGPKILDRVPFTIPLSWFTVGLASWILATQLSKRWLRTTAAWITIPIGVWLLVVWDLVLDPAMAHETMQARFWVWHQTGSYFGMPLINFVGWALTGAAFLTVTRLIWRSDLPSTLPAGLPFAVYAANMLFASVLCIVVGLWPPVIIAAVLGLIPATLAVLAKERPRDDSGQTVSSVTDTDHVVERAAWLVLRFLSRLTLRGRHYSGENLDMIPMQGPVIVAAQHIHHLDDGRALLALLPRHVRFLVALDWVPSHRWRRVMETLCHLAGWPVIVRPRELMRPNLVYDPLQGRTQLFAGLREALRRLRTGQAIVIFPEGYPLIDPHLPDRRLNNSQVYNGAVWLAHRAARTLGQPVPIVPIRLQYGSDRSIKVVAEAPILVSSTDDPSKLHDQLTVKLQRSSYEEHNSRFAQVLERTAE